MALKLWVWAPKTGAQDVVIIGKQFSDAKLDGTPSEPNERMTANTHGRSTPSACLPNVPGGDCVEGDWEMVAALYFTRTAGDERTFLIEMLDQNLSVS
jgi:hypothetical protein